MATPDIIIHGAPIQFVRGFGVASIQIHVRRILHNFEPWTQESRAVGPMFGRIVPSSCIRFGITLVGLCCGEQRFALMFAARWDLGIHQNSAQGQEKQGCPLGCWKCRHVAGWVDTNTGQVGSVSVGTRRIYNCHELPVTRLCILKALV